MRIFKLAIGLAAVAVMVLAAAASADCGHCQHGKEAKGHAGCMAKGDCPGYDSAAMTTLKGTVVSLDKETCKGCNMTHVDLVVKVKDEKVAVRLGPAWFIDNQDEMLKENDVVEIYASKLKHDDQDMFVAGKVSKGEDVLILRDKDGFPVWRGWRHGKV